MTQKLICCAFVLFAGCGEAPQAALVEETEATEQALVTRVVVPPSLNPMLTANEALYPTLKSPDIVRAEPPRATWLDQISRAGSQPNWLRDPLSVATTQSTTSTTRWTGVATDQLRQAPVNVK